MRIVTLSEVETDLQNLADQVGSDGFVQAKALYMEKVAVVDEEGKPMSADDLEIVIMPKMADDEEEEKAAHEEDEEDKAQDDDDKEKPKMAKLPNRKAVSTSAKLMAPAINKSRNQFQLKNLKDDANGTGFEKALRFGHWLLAGAGSRKSLNWCDKHGIEVKAHTEGINSQGGFLVPDEFETELISLREQFGVFRQNARVRPMASDTLRIPRRSATLTASFVGEAAAGTETTQTFEQVTLVAKKVMTLATLSSELQEDTFLANFVDGLSAEIAYSFAKIEDECGFLGDGTSTYGGIQGLKSKMGSAGIVQSGELGASEAIADQVTLAKLNELAALLPAYADTPQTKWYMHKSVFHAVAEKVARAVGGNTYRDILDGKAQPNLLGYPVVFAQAMANSSSTTDNDPVMYFGDLSLAASFGDRRQTRISVSEHATVNSGNVFEQDELAIRGTQRFDIVCHDTGDGTTAGPIVALTIDNDNA